jgi:hypothetical protein
VSKKLLSLVLGSPQGGFENNDSDRWPAPSSPASNVFALNPPSVFQLRQTPINAATATQKDTSETVRNAIVSIC